MKITKLGHCCLVIEEQGLRILTDPGNFSTAQDEVKDIDVVLITHEHGDHLHVESLKQVLQNNPQAKVYTNKGVGKILDEQNISYELLEDGQSATIKNITIEGLGSKHAPIYSTVPEVENTGYFINNRFFYPGDALLKPHRKVEVLALPVAGPWLKLSEAIDYAKVVHPNACFPVHDGMLNSTGPYHNHPKNALTKENIRFIIPTESEAMEF